MMRWNSTKTYTEDDILRMQQEAVTRVHEFQTRAKSLPFYDVPESAITPYREPSGDESPYEAPPDSAPPEPAGALPMPEPEPDPSDLPAGPPELPEQRQMNQVMEQQSQPVNDMQQVAHAAPTDPITGLLSKFNLDGETLLILGLMFLLYNEKADNVLLIALAYLLL